MMTENRSEIDEFYLFLEKLFRDTPKDIALEKLHEKAWERFTLIGLPTRKNEVFRYLKLRQLYSQTYECPPPLELAADAISPYIYPECQESVLVFVNGHFTPQLSRLKGLPEKMVVSSLSSAMRPYGALLTNHCNKAIKEESDPFALLNMAMHAEGAFLYLPPRTACQSPLQILYVTSGEQLPALSNPRLQLFVGGSAEIELFSTHAKLSSAAGCINQRVDMALEENAHVRYVQVNCHQNTNVWHFDALRATMKKSSTLKNVNVSNGSQAVRNDYHIALAGEGAEALLSGVWLLKGRREVHQHIYIDHQAPSCLSRQLFKGALFDQSHSSFEGKIMVRQAAQETNAFQLNNNLLLSEGASAESKPNLEIFADSVKASHGATVGQLEKEELFYLQSRGFTAETAKKLLVHGFCQEVVDLIVHPTLRKRIGAYVTEA